MSKMTGFIEGAKITGMLLILYIVWLIFKEGGIVEEGAEELAWWLIQPDDLNSKIVAYWISSGMTAENILLAVSGGIYPWMAQMTPQQGYYILWNGYYNTTPDEAGLIYLGIGRDLSIYDNFHQVKFGKAITWAAEQLAIYVTSTPGIIEQPEAGGDPWNW